jgi:multiple sugar transport system permease protein
LFFLAKQLALSKVGGSRDSEPGLIQKIIIYILLLLGSFIMILPFLWMLSASVKTNNEVFLFPVQWIPKVIHWENFQEIWQRIHFLTYYKNSIWLTVIVSGSSIFISSLAAYAFAKIPFPERKVMFLFYVLTMSVPFQVFMIPQFIIMKNIGLSDSLWALVLIWSFSPLCVFILRQFFMGIPEELSESARIDGLSEFGIYSRVIMPLSKPALSTLAILQFTFAWNDFLYPLIYLTSDRNLTIQLGIRKFLTQYGTEYGLVMAASVCALIPVILIFIFFQNYFIQGIATTGLKG